MQITQNTYRLIIVFLVFVILFTLLYHSISQPNENDTETIHPLPKHWNNDKESETASETKWRQPEVQKRLPQCIILGMRKAGTNALKNFMAIHPDVVAAWGEPHFFGKAENYTKGLEHYRNGMPESTSNQITIEKTPSYFLHENVCDRIKHFNSSIKLIVIVREPVTRSVSEYVQWDFLKGRTKPFEHYAMRHNGDVNNKYEPVLHSRYYKYAKFWLKQFPRKQIHFVNGDTLISDPVSALKPIEAFLGLKPYISEANFHYSKTKGFFCYVDSYGVETCLPKDKGRAHPDIDPKVTRKLINYFKPYNKRFFKLIGEDFGWPT